MYSTNPDRNDSSLVSVVIPAWNRADVLEYTLQSLRAQTYNAWEGLVVDDHSTDKTEDLVKKMAGADDRIAYQRRTQSAKGAPACRYQGLKKAKGKYVIFLDSDDRLHPRCLEGRVAVMETRPDLAYVVYPAELFSQNLGDTRLLWNTFSSTGDLDRFLKHDAPWQTTGPIWRTAYRRTFGHYWHETALSWQDWEFHTLALLDPVRYGKINFPDHFVRRSGDDNSAISRHDASTAHLLSRAKLYLKIAAALRDASLLTTDRSVCIQAAICGIAKHLIRESLNTTEAISVWRACFEFGLLTRRRYVEGAILLRCFAKSALSATAARAMQMRFPEYGELLSVRHERVTMAPAQGYIENPTEFSLSDGLLVPKHDALVASLLRRN